MQYCMDWRTIRFDWNRARAFLVTAEEGSLSAAARALGMAQPTLGRQVSALEQELGVVLFERVGNRMSLTPGGLQLLEQVRAMGAAASHLSLAASGRSQTVEGNVSISASEAAAAYVLPAIVRDLRRAHPGITVEIVASNAISDLRRREADIAIRAAQPTDPDLVARKLRDEQARLYATPAYLESIGGLAGPEDIARAAFVGFFENEQYITGLQAFGLPVTKESFPVQTASHLVHWELVKAGIAIGAMPITVGDAEPRVVQATPWLKPFVYPVWLVAHRELRTSRRLRLVFDFLANALA